MIPRSETVSDLVLLVSDKDLAVGIQALLSRPRALGIRSISFKIHKHPDRDPGCYRKAQEFLRPLTERHRYALVLFDYEGCGSAAAPPKVEVDVRSRLERSGWSGRCDVVVIDPELECWVWGPSPKVAECLGWGPERPPLRDWLEGLGLWARGESKPRDPKAAVEKAREETGKRRSPRLYQLLGTSVTTRGCTDPSFNRFREILQRWFPAR